MGMVDSPLVQELEADLTRFEVVLAQILEIQLPWVESKLNRGR